MLSDFLNKPRKFSGGEKGGGGSLPVAVFECGKSLKEEKDIGKDP